MLSLERQGTTSVLRMAHGKASAFDLEFVAALEGALGDFERSDARALVVTGSGSIFSAGVDLVRLVRGGADYVAQFLPALESCLARFLRCERPIVAAINGHAIAGGCVLACAADRRVLARGKATLGAPELKVGVPFPPSALEALRLVAPPPLLSRMALDGRMLAADEALAQGLVDELVEPQQLESRALALAAELGSIPARSFAHTKHLLRHAALASIDRSARDPKLLAAWSAPETLAAVAEYVARTLKK